MYWCSFNSWGDAMSNATIHIDNVPTERWKFDWADTEEAILLNDIKKEYPEYVLDSYVLTRSGLDVFLAAREQKGSDEPSQ